jgi:hypothetical protein
MTYGDISIGDATNMTALTAACDQLLLSAVQTLVTSQAREYYTVDCYCPIPLLPGQTVKIENATGTTPAVTTTPNWVILEVTERLVNGRPRTTLSVSNMSGCGGHLRPALPDHTLCHSEPAPGVQRRR